MKTVVIDACALIAFLFDEDGSDLFESILIQARNNEIQLIMHIVNLGEVYYDILKRNDVKTAQQTYKFIKQLPVRFENHISDQMIFIAGELKANYRMSYADSFAAAQTILFNAELLTSDHKEFEPLKQANKLRVRWLR
jgi:predicted nucleic acid-binding protein